MCYTKNGHITGIHHGSTHKVLYNKVFIKAILHQKGLTVYGTIVQLSTVVCNNSAYTLNIAQLLLNYWATFGTGTAESKHAE